MHYMQMPVFVLLSYWMNTQGDRFGGALDGAARQFSAAFDSGQTPADFVTSSRKKGELIMGIGHRVKSVTILFILSKNTRQLLC